MNMVIIPNTFLNQRSCQCPFKHAVQHRFLVQIWSICCISLWNYLHQWGRNGEPTRPHDPGTGYLAKIEGTRLGKRARLLFWAAGRVDRMTHMQCTIVWAWHIIECKLAHKNPLSNAYSSRYPNGSALFTPSNSTAISATQNCKI